MKHLSVVTPCCNEESNVENLYRAVKAVFQQFPGYTYEHIFIDNSSRDNTLQVLKKLAQSDTSLKIIVNVRNFGHIRSPYYALLQANGDAAIVIASDFQDPPELITDFLKKWEEGYKIVIGVKNNSEENRLMFAARKIYYNLIAKLSDTEQVKNFTGFGLYDRSFVAVLKQLNEPYPYFRGLIAELGSERAEIDFTQPKRKKGKTKNNFYTLYDIAMLGLVSYSKVPLRIATFMGFISSFLSILVALVYFIYKLLFWNRFSAGAAPITIGLFFFASVQLFFVGILGEYIGAIYTQVKNRPLVIEKERVNF
ncbi:MAG: glycosyltransferase family 2 protein [Endomicrobiales bacterium]